MNLAHIHNIIRLCAVLLLIQLFSEKLYAQDSILAPTLFKKIDIARKHTRNAQTLALKLTAGKTTEKERFDALFTWVVTQIDYDYQLYRSGKAFQSDKPIRKILRKRSGLCLDYAHLMDTLCFYAGIQNTTITGYTKELHFDLKDSLYFDNHAWNAVKLNGLWYVYDITWCTGSAVYDYTKIGKWRKRMIRRLAQRTRVSDRTLSMKQKKNAYCDQDKKFTLKTHSDTVIRFFPNQIIKLLNFPKFRLKITHQAVANTLYYLSNPEFFALTHFPNDPIWSFSQRLNNVNEFSTDSMYFDVSKIPNDFYKRKGILCIDCDDYMMLDSLKRSQILSGQSKINNPNNHAIPAQHYQFVTKILYKQVLNTSDSLAKMNAIDSAVSVIRLARVELKQSATASKKEAHFHIRKNKDKKTALQKQNKEFIAIAKDNNRQITRKYHRLRSLNSKTHTFESNQRAFKRKFDRMFYKTLNPKKMKEETRVKLSMELNQNLLAIDSLHTKISELQTHYTSDATKLWENLFQEKKRIFPLESAIDWDNDLRLLYGYDNYDLMIIQQRAIIDKLNKDWNTSTQIHVIQLADSVFEQYVKLGNLVKARNAFAYKAAQQQRSLVQGGFYSATAIQAFRERIQLEIKSELCWNSTYGTINFTICNQFKSLNKQIRNYVKLLYRNNGCELKRYKIHERHILRNKARQMDMISSNLKVLNEMMKQLIQQRKDFLTEWRKTH